MINDDMTEIELTLGADDVREQCEWDITEEDAKAFMQRHVEDLHLIVYNAGLDAILDLMEKDHEEMKERGLTHIAELDQDEEKEYVDPPRRVSAEEKEEVVPLTRDERRRRMREIWDDKPPASERAIRRLAERWGHRIAKSRSRSWDNLGGYKLSDENFNLVLGPRYDATLSECHAYLIKLT